MTDDERDRTLLEGFQFAIRALPQAHDLNIPATEGDRVWDLLREVAEGKVTMAGSPADLLHRFPNAKPEVVEMMWRNVNKLIAKDRDLARRIFEAFQREVDEITDSMD